MKLTYSLSIALLFGVLCKASASDILKTEKIQKVIVFRNGAQIESKISQSIEKGEHLLIIDELPNSLDENTVQVSGEGDFTIISVESKMGSNELRKKGSAYQALLDSIEYYSTLIDMDVIRKYAVDQEEDLLISNKNISSKQALEIVDIEDLAELYKKRLPELKRESYRLAKLINENTARLQLFKQQLAERQAGKNNKQIWIRVSLTQAQNVRISLKYLVQDASWDPFYDVRSNDIGENVIFILKANVRQSTGVNWENVELTLSTGNPVNYTAKPVLSDWRLSLTEFIAYERLARSGTADMIESKTLPSRNINSLAASASFIEVRTEELANNVQFNITKAFTIESDGDKKILEIQRSESKANYRYVSVPKIDNKAFLIASISDWDKNILLAGEANIFLDGSYVTKTYIDPMSIEDSLDLSFGNDESIKIERKMLRELTSKKTFGGTKKIVQAFDISVRNTKNKAINIQIQDQVPLSTDKEIEVSFTAVNANHEPETGKLTWNYSIAPSESKKMNFQIEVKYPKNKVLQGW
jgi:uncharacterized protein (TIGR02231 family)